MQNNTQDYREHQIQDLWEDPYAILDYLKASLEAYNEDGNHEALIIALYTIDKALDEPLGTVIIQTMQKLHEQPKPLIEV